MFKSLTLLVLLISSSASSPRRGKSSFIGDGTNELAIALLQGYSQNDANLVFSPTAYSIILAIISEGAKGETQEEIRRVLHFPEDIAAARQAYYNTIQRLRKNTDHGPEFKNWFYVYKNYTVEKEFVETLKQHYLTEVRKIERPSEIEEEDVEEEYERKKKPIEPDQEKPKEKPLVIDPEKTAASIIENGGSPHKVDAEEATSNNQVAMFDSRPDDKKEEQTTTVKSSDVTTEKENEERVKESEVEKEMMIAMQRSGRRTREDSSVKKTEEFTGMTDSSLKIHGNGSKSQMILFNGLHFYGEWDFPLTKNAKDETKPFYKSETEKVVVPTIHAEGTFNIGTIPTLDSTVVELPYIGDRYKLLLLVPETRSGLSKLTADLSGFTVSDLYKHMTKKSVEICLPIFEINTISKPISSLSKLGMSKVTKVFNPKEADLSGIAPDPGLYIEELVQFVSFDVDNEKGEVSQLTASSAASRSEYEKVAINRPFLFFLQDKSEGIIIVAGKVVDPSVTEDADDFMRKKQ